VRAKVPSLEAVVASVRSIEIVAGTQPNGLSVQLVSVPVQVPVIGATALAVRVPLSPSSQPPVTVYVPVSADVADVEAPVAVTVITCPLTLGEVSVTFVPLTVPVKSILLDESKQSEPYMYIVPATLVPVCVRLPPT
jgi:hypothetical protein